MVDMPAQLGFDEQPLAEARLAVVTAIRTAHLPEYQDAWRCYQELAEAQIEALSDDLRPRAQISLILAKAEIWRECNDRVRYFEELRDAGSYAEGMGYEDVIDYVNPILNRGLTSHSFMAESLHALGSYDDAMHFYIEREQDECLTDLERGLVNVRLAECYRGLLDESRYDDDLRGLLEVTIHTALEFLKNMPEQVLAMRLLEELESA